MSNHLISLAYKVQVGSLLRKSVLVLLADKASDDGSGIWASKQTIADELCCSKQAVIKTMQEFQDEGLLVEMGRKKHRNGYTITYALKIASLEALPRVKRWADNPSTVLTGQPALPVNDDELTSQPGLPKPSLTPQSEAKASYTEASARIFQKWNEVAVRCDFKTARVLDASRKQTLRLRLKEHGEARLMEAIDLASKSPWLKGQGRDTAWRPDFDFLLKPGSIRKILEGSYGEDEKQPRRLTGDEARDAALKTAASMERIGRHDDAEEIRRRWTAQPIGSVASKIMEGVRTQ